MLDNLSKEVYEVLKKLTGEDDIFKVIEANEVLEKLSENMTTVQLSAIIRDLRDREYIKVKYFTPDEYCLLTLKKVEELASIAEEVATIVEKKPEIKTAAASKTVQTIGAAKVFWAAFLGALLGGGVIAAIAVILQLFVF